MDIINEIRQELDALADARGISKSVLIVDIAQKLSQVEHQVEDLQKQLDELKAAQPADSPDGETIDGVFYPYGGAKK